MGIAFCSELGRNSGMFCNSTILTEENTVEEIPKFVRSCSTSEDQINRSRPELGCSHSMPQLFDHKSLKANDERKQKRKQKHVPSLMEIMQDRKQHRSNDFIEGEHQAKIYMDTVQDDSILQVTETLEVANSIIEKGNDMSEELARQRVVTSKANHDLDVTEHEIHDTNYMLKGMMSIPGKISNMVRKKPKHKPYGQFLSEPSLFKNCETRARSATSPLPSGQTAEEKQKWLQGSVSQLSSAMDIIKSQQLDFKEELELQEGDLEHFGRNIDNIEGKIKHQTHLMSGIR